MATKTCFLIIDPQNDFHPKSEYHGDGSLAVQGANEDSERVAKLIREHSDKIDHIVITLDSHHPMHIANKHFWVSSDGKTQPEPFTLITAEEVKNGKWKAARSADEKWAIDYVAKLEAQEKFKLCIWPEHCLIGTPGHNVVTPIMNAANEWARSKKQQVHFILKGSNNHTEMYSAIRAEVPIAEDPKTDTNKQLLDDLQNYNRILVGGQAKSHCVNYTVRDIVQHWPQDRLAQIHVLEDCMSAVGGFEGPAEQFITDMKNKGVTVTTHDKAF
eukprot:TRINITY_DN19910_c0_g1_i1.p1 TRINITY_DN19910_c0_g1~~TRINITY_DN19910_c0_g1_i1.p1  ORF type:complete len:272 (-),score=34.04 TRINITY_DN19910_c0_g1_i1:152-967(-)